MVFCNFDGSDKQPAEVGMDALIGSGTMLVSPIKVGARALIGAGSVVTKNIANDESFVQSRCK